MSSITELNLDDLNQVGPSIFYNGQCIISTDTDVHSPAANEQLAKSLYCMIESYQDLLTTVAELVDENRQLSDQIDDLYEERY